MTVMIQMLRQGIHPPLEAVIVPVFAVIYIRLNRHIGEGLAQRAVESTRSGGPGF